MTDGTQEGADLRGFLEAAGRSFNDAQGTLIGDILPQPPALAISEAELEVKAAMGQNGGGTLAFQPLSAADVRSGGISPGLVSSVRVRFVATAGEPPSVVAPTRSTEDVIATVRQREDVVVLNNILGGLDIQPVFVAESQRWLVTAIDGQGRIVREVVVPDQPEEG